MGKLVAGIYSCLPDERQRYPAFLERSVGGLSSSRDGGMPMRAILYGAQEEQVE